MRFTIVSTSNGHLTLTRGFVTGTRAEAPRTVPPAPYNSNAYLSNQSGNI